ncbi:hypothetical protein IM40_08030 [Candidatus Paracaedimonas acanthamoebae]|nr:hypothetical protein IM40_08030 [Candidatus Paracaedimonas acanthamoebae]
MNISKRWIRKKYFTTFKTRTWTFYGILNRERMAQKQVKLFYTTDVPILRHIRVKGEMNPYDPLWKTYFENRQQKATSRNLERRQSQCLV